ncbi:MAG: hypothetical protein ABIL11_01025 [Chloroflexota bacterium]
MEVRKWLLNEDKQCYDERLARLEWLASITPAKGAWLFHGGLTTKSLFEETRYCFIYGQFLSTIVLGFSFIEHSLASLLYGAGYNELERVNASSLVKKAFAIGLIDKIEWNRLERIRKFRNPIVHFRRPDDKDRIETSMVQERKNYYELVEKEARFVMIIIMRLLGKLSEAM